MYSESRHTQYEENQFAKFRIDSRILFLDLKPGVRHDLSAAKQIVADRIRIQEGKTFPVLCDISGVHSTTKAAREYLTGFGSELVKAIAFINRPAFQPNLLTPHCSYMLPKACKSGGSFFLNSDLGTTYFRFVKG